MSLVAAVADWESRRGGETRAETPMKQPERVFHGEGRNSDLMKHAEPQKSAISAPRFTVSSPRARNSETSLPPAIVVGVAKLRSGWQPCKVDGGEWRAVVGDVRRIVADGWAEQALALGWSPHDVFGIGPGGSNEWLSLAVWLAGRTITMMDDHRAFTDEGPVYYLERWGRPNTVFVEPIFLWEMGA